MRSRYAFLPLPLHDALSAVGNDLTRGKKVGTDLETAIGLFATLPPHAVGRWDGAIAHTAGLYPRRPRTVWSYLIGRRPSDAAQLRRTPELKYLFLFHRDGRLREAALDGFSEALPDPFACAAILWRLNDWAEPVREAAVRCAERSFPRTDAAVLAKAVAELLVRQASWGRWGVGRQVLDALVAREDVAENLALLIMTRPTGPWASALRNALRTPALDQYLFRLAVEAAQPPVRAVALAALISGKAEWPSGWAWKWIDKSMGLRRRVPIYEDRAIACTSCRDGLIAQGLNDRSAAVRRVALDGVIRHMMAQPERREYALAVAGDRSPAVRERAAFILRNAN